MFIIFWLVPVHGVSFVIVIHDPLFIAYWSIHFIKYQLLVTQSYLRGWIGITRECVSEFGWICGTFLGVVEGMHKCSSAARSSCLNVETELNIVQFTPVYGLNFQQKSYKAFISTVLAIYNICMEIRYGKSGHTLVMFLILKQKTV